MTIKTTYKGHEIHWADNEDAWTCRELGVSSKSMVSLRTMIDRVVLSVRKKSAVQALQINDQGVVREATVIQYLGAERGYRASEMVAIMGPSFFGDKLSRQKVSLQDLMPVGDEVLEQARQLREIREQQLKLGERAAALYRAIPRLTKEHIAELVRIADAGEIEA